MRKRALLAMLLVLSLILSGCTLIQKDEAVDAATEIIRLGDQVVTKGEINDAVDYQLNYMSYLYSMYGYSYDTTDEDNIADVRESVISSYESDLVINAKIAELGLDQLTEEEEAEIQQNAEDDYNEYLEYIKSANYEDSELSDEEIDAKAKEDMEELGYTMDAVLEEARSSFLTEKLRQEIIKDVTVTDEDIQEEYDSRVESAKSAYAENASSWCSAANNGTSTLYYTPAGVRYVKQILVKFTDEDQAAIDAADEAVTAAEDALEALTDDATEEEKTAAQAALEDAEAALESARNTAFANIDEKTDEIIAELDAGADWDTLMAEKTEDPGMQSGTTAERGYAVCEGMTSFDSAFVEAAMALENIGDVSPKTKGSAYGYYIIKYVADAEEGAIALDEVKETIESSLLSTKQSTVYSEQIQAWVDEADFTLNLSALDD